MRPGFHTPSTSRVSGNPGTPNSFRSSNNITNRPLTGASVAWSPPSWTQGDQGAAQQTSGLTALVQAVVDQGAWNPGNAIVFVIDGTGTRTRTAEAGEFKQPEHPFRKIVPQSACFSS